MIDDRLGQCWVWTCTRRNGELYSCIDVIVNQGDIKSLRYHVALRRWSDGKIELLPMPEQMYIDPKFRIDIARMMDVDPEKTSFVRIA